jgi:endonuclease/exonuclease/phosphatase family metal-dependent hydrolase
MRLSLTWHPNPGRPEHEKSELLDYCFLTPDLVAHASSAHVDESAQGSDHQPLWVEFDAS